MVNTNAAIPIRSGTKATPQAVFAACDRLRAEIGDFRNEDVLAITGGGMGPVSRLVRLYNQASSVGCVSGIFFEFFFRHYFYLIAKLYRETT